MSTKAKLACLLLVLSLTAFAAADISAQCCPGTWWGGMYSCYGEYYGWSFEQPPYFACYPPVYYRIRSESVHYSSVPWVYRPATAPAKPLLIDNPYVDGNTAGSDAAGSSAAKPLRLANAYAAAQS